MKMIKKAKPSLFVSLGLTLAIASSALSSQEVVYTIDSDFVQGSLNSLEYDALTESLVLSETGSTFPVLWVANAGEDSVSKINTDTDCEEARYSTWFFTNFHGAYSGPAPSRTAVDIEGNVYVANRHFDNKPPSVMKILAEGGIDRNGNGVIDTSRDVNGDCSIDRNDPNEMPMPVDSNGNGIYDADEIVDERIAWVKQIGGDRGLGRSLCIAPDGNIWLGMYNASEYYRVDSDDGTVLNGPIGTPGHRPYGCLIDGDGILWSATLSSVMAVVDTNLVNTASDPFLGTKSIRASGYGIALANDKVYFGRSGRDFNEYDPNAPEGAAPANDGNPLTGEFTLAPNFNTQYGISSDGDGNLIGGLSTVIKTRPDGTRVWSTPNPTSTSVGVAVDSNQNVWVMGLNSNNVAKFDGATGNQLLIKPVGANPYTYSDSTGFAARNVTDRSGIWIVTRDSGSPGTEWDMVSWNNEPDGDIPPGSSIRVRYRASDVENQLELISYQDASNGNPGLGAVGRFMQMRVELRPNDDGDSPHFSDLALATLAEFGVCDVNEDGFVDRFDLNLIISASGPAAANDPLDIDNNGVINRLDARACVDSCTNARCAVTAPQ